MLWLRAVTHEGEFVKCALTGQIMTYSMRYFYDDETGECYNCNEYYNIKKTKREETFNELDIYVSAKQRWDDAATERTNRRSENQDTVLDKTISYKDAN